MPSRHAPPVPEDEYARACAYAVRALSQREYSRRQLRAKLLQKGFSASLASALLDDLAARDYQSDTRFARQFAALALERRGRAPAAILRELRACGVDEETARRAVEELGPGAESAALKRAVERRLRALGAPAPENRARWIAYLRRLGFRPMAIREALDGRAAFPEGSVL
jgi:regulatory protein